MAKQPGKPADDPSSAPESGTERDETSGNNPTHGRQKDPANASPPGKTPAKDDPSTANEEP